MLEDGCSSVAEAVGAGPGFGWNADEPDYGQALPWRQCRSSDGDLVSQKGYEDPRWMTYKQAADQGWQVRKGEKGTQIEFWEVKPYSRQRDDRDQPQGDDEQTGRESLESQSGLKVYPSRVHRLQCQADRRRTGSQTQGIFT